MIAQAILFTNIGELVTNDLTHGQKGSSLKDAALMIADGVVMWSGSSASAPIRDAGRVIDVEGGTVIPGFVDSHTHLVFASDRAEEFEARMAGRKYTAGGIASTVRATREATNEQLSDQTAKRVKQLYAQGTTSYEIKSGYGLSIQDEARMLRIAQTFTEETTFLGGHVVPQEYAYDPQEYVELVRGPMLQECAPYAKWIDVFCDLGAFTVEQGRQMLKAGKALGLGARVHASHLAPGEGIDLAVEVDAASVDHCTYATDQDLDMLAASNTVATLLPGVEFFTRSPYPDAKRFLQAGVQVALASDCNPGSCFTSSMPFCIALAVREMSMTFEQALYAATAQGAKALRRTDIGHLRPGAKADFVVLDAPKAIYLAYRPGMSLVKQTWVSGQRMF